MKVWPKGLAPFVKIGHSSNKRDSTTSMTSFGRQLRTRDGRRQPPCPAATSVVREFYANLASHVVKKVRVRGVLVEFGAKSINQFYNLDPVPPEPFDTLHERPDYPRSYGF